MYLRGERRLSFDVEARVPTTKLRQFTVQNISPDIEQQVGYSRRTTHLLLLHKSPGHKLAGCGQRTDPRIIEGHRVAEKFRVYGIGVPIGPDLFVLHDRIGFGGGLSRRTTAARTPCSYRW
ncbi:hypothetical protein [Variovorax gracilis]|uniref:hypothetical protein n=1 Tax=Variovorax gracilis TaxID=3053502 RepID=UPI004037B27B